ncbi:MAG: glycosyltransferase [Rhodospirillales bacterium]|nr:glycosyltransferase [Rhodospirillales bacterium]
MGGAERVMLMLADALIARGHALDIVLTRREGYFADALPAGARVCELGMASHPALWRALVRLPGPVARTLAGALAFDKAPKAVRSLPRLVDYLQGERPDAVLTTLPYNNLTALWAAALAGEPRRPSVPVVVREASVLSRAHVTKRFDRRLADLVGMTYPGAAGIVAISDGVGDDLARITSLSRARITTIYNPIDVARAEAAAAAPVAEPWLAAGAPPMLLAVGRMTPQKDHATLLRAFARVIAARPARLVILGDGPERGTLDALARSLGIDGHVRLVGLVDNPFPYYRHAAVFVLSSAWEGFGNVLLEALACGCPVVSTDCPSGPAEILGHGRWGRLAPVGDAEALAACILRTLDAPPAAEALRQRARMFTIDAALDRYLDLLIGDRQERDDTE